MKHIIFISAMAIALSACNNKPQPQEEEQTNTDTLSISAYELDMEKISAKEEGCKTKDCTYITLTIPVLSEGETAVRSSVNDFIDSRIREYVKSRLPEPMGNASLQNMAEQFIEGYELFMMEFPDSDQKWYLEIKGDSTILAEEYITVFLKHSDYLGGAHSNSFDLLQTFDLATGTPIELDQKFDMEALRKEAESKFRKIHSLGPKDNLNDAGFLFENGVFTLPENMGLTKDGLRLIYNSYEVAAYAKGKTDFTIPYAAIMPAV